MSIPDSIIILFVILGAAGAVCMGFAINRLFYKTSEVNFNVKSQPQMDYQREVRDRTKMAAMLDARGNRQHEQY